MSEKRLLQRIRRDARRIARRFGLKYMAILKESKRALRYGSCDEERIIRIRLHNLGNGEFLRYPNLMLTLCHELAHLKHMDHRSDFQELHEDIVDWAREKGIYRPLLKK